MSQKSYSDIIRKWSRLLHRDLSFFFCRHTDDLCHLWFYAQPQKGFQFRLSHPAKPKIRFTEPIPANPQEINREFAERLLKTIGEENRYLKHYSPEPGCIKIFIKGGSSLVIHTESGEGIYESIKKRPVISWFNRLHYNPSRWWTVFSDIFILSLLIITFTGLIMIKGPKGFWGRGGIEFALGLLIPIGFIFFS